MQTIADCSDLPLDLVPVVLDYAKCESMEFPHRIICDEFEPIWWVGHILICRSLNHGLINVDSNRLYDDRDPSRFVSWPSGEWCMNRHISATVSGYDQIVDMQLFEDGNPYELCRCIQLDLHCTYAPATYVPVLKPLTITTHPFENGHFTPIADIAALQYDSKNQCLTVTMEGKATREHWIDVPSECVKDHARLELIGNIFRLVSNNHYVIAKKSSHAISDSNTVT